jgi:hypothetical protein
MRAMGDCGAFSLTPHRRRAWCDGAVRSLVHRAGNWGLAWNGSRPGGAACLPVELQPPFHVVSGKMMTRGSQYGEMLMYSQNLWINLWKAFDLLP